jgi:hypothetical protein
MRELQRRRTPPAIAHVAPSTHFPAGPA